jgi:outer membrane protein assembly factor BamB
MKRCELALPRLLLALALVCLVGATGCNPLKRGAANSSDVPLEDDSSEVVADAQPQDDHKTSDEQPSSEGGAAAQGGTSVDDIAPPDGAAGTTKSNPGVGDPQEGNGEAADDGDQVATAEGDDVAAAKAGPEADPLDWTYWRGPEYNGISRETGLIDDWNPKGGEGSNVVWKREDLGTRSTPIVMRGKLYTLTRSYPGTAKEGERAICVDAATGQTVWEHNFNVWHSDVPDTRVGWSSIVGDPETGNVYALGVCGYFACLDGETGKVIWSRASHEQDGFLSTYGGRTNFPVIFEDLVIVSSVYIGWGEMAKPNHRFMAFDKRTGEIIWFNGTTPLPDDTTYSAPAISVIDGKQSLVVACGDGRIWSFQPRTGAPIWNYALSRRGVNTPPLVVGDRVFCSHSEEVPEAGSNKMGGVVALNAKGAKVGATNELWRIDERMCGKSAPILAGGLVYVFEDGGVLRIFNADTGEEVPLDIDSKIERQIKLRNMRASPLLADGKIYAISEAGQWWIAKPDKAKGLEVVSFSKRDTKLDETYASPIASHGRVYITTTGAMYCLEDKAKKHGVAARPKSPAEAPAKDDPKPAFVQVVPAEVLLRPGETQDFKVRLFNSHGQFLREEKGAQLSVKGAGKISGAQFTAPQEAKHEAAYVDAKVGDLVGEARVRIIPDLPWKFDFEGVALDQKNPAGKMYGEPPVTWVGMRYRHVVREMDGNKVMVKVTTIPKGTRSQGFLGPTDLHDYTLQADVMGQLVLDAATKERLAAEGREPTPKDGQMPEIGINVQGYTLAIQGNNQVMQLRTWVTQERLDLHPANRTADGQSKCKIPFAWKPNTWYTMKLRVENEGDVAKLYGKVWPKGEAEPAEWSITGEDPAPQRVGAPGFFGMSDFAEIYIDNIVVTPNA